MFIPGHTTRLPLTKSYDLHWSFGAPYASRPAGKERSYSIGRDHKEPHLLIFVCWEQKRVCLALQDSLSCILGLLCPRDTQERARTKVMVPRGSDFSEMNVILTSNQFINKSTEVLAEGEGWGGRKRQPCVNCRRNPRTDCSSSIVPNPSNPILSLF